MRHDLQVDNKEDVRKLHASLIRLLIDHKEFESFQQSPAMYAEKLGNVPNSYKQLVSKINIEGLKTFRNIVQGTRQERFRQVFSRLHESIGDEIIWDNMIADFLAKTVVKNGRDDTDLYMFEAYARQWQNSVIADLATFDRAIYSASNSPPAPQDHTTDRNPHQQFQINPWVERLESTRPAKALSSLPIEDLKNLPKDSHFTLIYLTIFDQSLRLRSLGPDLASYFKQWPAFSGTQLTELLDRAPIVQKLLDEGAIGAVANVQ